MRRRILITALAAALAVAGLAGCRTNVGVAARVEGQRITESQVNDYLTAAAKPVRESDGQNGTVQLSPRSFVVSELITEQLIIKVFRALPSGAPQLAKVDAEVTRQLNGRSYRSAAERLGLKGFTSDFYKRVLRVQTLSSGLQTLAQAGIDVSGAVRKLHFDVWVSPRYGEWDPQTLALKNAPAVPSYLTVQPLPDAGAQAQPAG